MAKQSLLAALLAVLVASAAWAEKQAIPAGTTLHCRLAQTLNTRSNFMGDAFRATVSEPLVISGHDAIPVGATLTGRVSWMTRPGRVRGVGEMRLTAESVTLPDGRTFPLSALLLSAYGVDDAKVSGNEGVVKGPSSRFRSIEEIGAFTGGGGIVGLLFAHPVVGMAVGGAVGFVDRARRRGQDLNLPQGTQLNYQLTRDLVIQQR